MADQGASPVHAFMELAPPQVRGLEKQAGHEAAIDVDAFWLALARESDAGNGGNGNGGGPGDSPAEAEAGAVTGTEKPSLAASEFRFGAFRLGDGFMLPNIPLVAVYGMAYIPCNPLALIQFPSERDFLASVLPPPLVALWGLGAGSAAAAALDAELEAYVNAKTPASSVLTAASLDAEMDAYFHAKTPASSVPTAASLDAELEAYMGAAAAEVVAAAVLPELYAVVHTTPTRMECQKFTCSNTDEINLMYHTWVNADIDFISNPYFVSAHKVPLGVYSAVGVKAVHQDLQDAGVSFEAMEERSVVIHDQCFSPENAMLQLDDEFAWHTFFSAGEFEGRRVAVLHMIPNNDAVEREARLATGSAATLGDLVTRLPAPAGEALATLLVGLL